MTAPAKLGPNSLVPCPSASARRRHLAQGRTCRTCDTEAQAVLVRVGMCPECRDRVPIVGSAFSDHLIRVVRSGVPTETDDPCPGSGGPARPISALSAALRDRRNDLGLTQLQVADRASQPRSVIASLESGVSPMRVPGLIAVADALGCELAVVPRSAA